MTTGTGQLATAAAQRDAARLAANEATIRQNMTTVLATLQERIAALEETLSNETKRLNGYSMALEIGEGMIQKLEAENNALRAVAVAVEQLEAHEMGVFAEFGRIPNEDLADEYMRSLLYVSYEAMRRARAAGYLPAEGVSS